MCGIAGIISSQVTDLCHIQRMTELQKHRGPDSGALAFFTPHTNAHFQASDKPLSKTYTGNLAFGHRRLAIIDTSNAGIQPMLHEDSGCWITYNGEIYNYKELREELRLLGAHFHTESDTEVILAAYATWGTQCFSRFHGMWALAIYDPKEQSVILSRDRFGIKPLHYTILEDRLYFSSEIKALLSVEGVSRKANLAAVKSYLTHQLVNHTNATFFESIHAFPPAHWVKLPLQNPSHFSPQPYWHFNEEALPLTYTQAKDTFKQQFDMIMNQHMRSDVTVGACLSGGLDSSAILCTATNIKNNQSQLHSFTAIFEDKHINETPWVNAANAKAHAIPHWVTPTANDLLQDIDAMIWHQEEPFTSASIFAQWSVMKEAQKAQIPVLLDGQGADEILCGYKKFYIQYLKCLFIQKKWLTAIRELAAYIYRGDRSILRILSAQRYLPKWLRSDIRTLEHIQTALLKQTPSIPAPSLLGASSMWLRQQQDISCFSVPALLRFEDRNSMAFSIESRVPFLDHRLVSFCLNLPSHMKLYNGTSKRIMRDALADVIPQSILNRRDKMGFGAPEDRWLKEAILSQLESDCMSNRFALSALIDKQALQTMIARAKKKKKSRDSRLLFQLFILNRWATHFNVSLHA